MLLMESLSLSTPGFHDREQVVALLSAEGLPVADLPEELGHFVVANHHDSIIGVAGLEVYGTDGLLRSLAVQQAFRNRGLASELLQSIEQLAVEAGINRLYLLTETAADYFARKEYVRIPRSEVGPAVRQSSEFSHVCPQSAIVMYKSLKNL